jgi:predicted metalloprotease
VTATGAEGIDDDPSGLPNVEPGSGSEIPADTTAEPVPDTIVPPDEVPPTIAIPQLDGPFPFDPDKPAQPYDGFLVAAIDDIQGFWDEAYPTAYDGPYLTLQGGIFPVYPGRQGVPGCGDPQTTYNVIEGNAFYCPDGDFIAYDDHALFPALVEQLAGVFPLAVVMAHEWGHAIQARFGLQGPTILFEQQADCFAGAWVGHLAQGGNPNLVIGDNEVNQAINAMIAVRDEPGSAASDPAAHGSAFDRVGAFQQGYVSGVIACAGYENDPPQVMQFQFTIEELSDPARRDPDDVRYEEIVPLLQPDLDAFWTEQMQGANAAFTPPALVASTSASAACPDLSNAGGGGPGGGGPGDMARTSVYCPSTNQVLYDEALTRDLYERYGDYAVGIVLAWGWSEAVQVSLGSAVRGEARSLLNDCLIGSWTRSTLPPTPRDVLSVSPGDLDEGVQALIDLSDDSSAANVVGSAFERIEALRIGVFGGTSACVDRYANS